MRRVSLRIQLMLLIILYVIPLGVCMIIFSRQLICQTQDELTASYQNELSQICLSMDRNLRSMDRGVQNLFRGCELELEYIQQGTDDPLTDYSLWRKIKALRESAGFVDGIYIKIKDRDEILFTQNASRISNAQRQEWISCLKSDYFSMMDRRSILFYELGDHQYFLCNFEYANFSIGYIIDVETLFYEWSRICTPQELVQISDADNHVLAERSVGNPEEGTQALIVSCEIMDGQYHISRSIAINSIQSASYRLTTILQLLVWLFVMLLPLMWIVIRKKVLSPLRQIVTALNEVQRENFEYRITGSGGSEEFDYLDHMFNDMTGNIYTLRVKSYEKQIEQIELEAEILRLQINPHLLTNSLNIIFSMAGSHKDAEIQKYTLLLINHFRYALKRHRALVTLKEELDFVHDYLEIQKVRFPEDFEWTIHAASEAQKIELPPLLIQNFVENAVKHGRIPGMPFAVDISAVYDDSVLRIGITDNGVGFDPEILQMAQTDAPLQYGGEQHIGIYNCRRRLQNYFGERASLHIISEPGKGTTIQIEIIQG